MKKVLLLIVTCLLLCCDRVDRSPRRSWVSSVDLDSRQSGERIGYTAFNFDEREDCAHAFYFNIDNTSTPSIQKLSAIRAIGLIRSHFMKSYFNKDIWINKRVNDNQTVWDNFSPQFIILQIDLKDEKVPTVSAHTLFAFDAKDIFDSKIRPEDVLSKGLEFGGPSVDIESDTKKLMKEFFEKSQESASK